MKIVLDEIKIKVKVTDGKMKAIVSLDFGDFVIKGFRVQQSEFENKNGNKVWVTPPCYKSIYKWHPIVYFLNKELWKELEDRILKEYDLQSKTYQEKVYGIENF